MQALSAKNVNMVIKSIAKLTDIPKAEKYSGNSLRRGFATIASQYGVTLRSIMRKSRWKNETTVRGYIQEGQRFKANAAGRALENIVK